MFDNIYQGKKVFLTGHTGFKGSWLALWLTKLGAQVCGYSLAPNTQPSLFETLHIAEHISQSIIGDILDEEKLEIAFQTFQPNIVFHLAAQPLVRRSYIEPILTYKTNVMGSLYVLEHARRCSSVQAFVNITSDKCYENSTSPCTHLETNPLGGYDMYASSKGCVEIMSSSFRRSFLQQKGSMAMATARAGNVMGGGDWAQDRLIPDCIRALVQHTPIEIRNPHAIRPWQHVLEPLAGYLLLGQKLLQEGSKYATAFNFGPDEKNIYNVADIAEELIKIYGQGHIQLHPQNDLHEDSLLLLNSEKAKRLLGWTSVYTPNQALTKTVEWYKHFYQHDTDILAFTIQQIADYEQSMCKNQQTYS